MTVLLNTLPLSIPQRDFFSSLLVENHEAFAALGFAKVAQSAHPGFDRPTSITMRKPVRRMCT